MTPLVSIVIPAFNAAAFLSETLESALSQTYPNIEIIVVDDGSTDNTRDIVARCATSAVQYLHQSNAGVSAARNAGFRHSHGEFVCFMDADDWFYPENIAAKVSAMQHHASAALVHAAVEVTDGALQPTGHVMRGKSGKVLSDLLQYAPPAIPCPSNALIRRSALEQVGLFDTQLSTSADYEMWLRLASAFDVIALPEVLVKYRVHAAGMFANLALQVHDMEYIFKQHTALLATPEGRTLRSKFYLSVGKAALQRKQWKLAAITLNKWMWS